MEEEFNGAQYLETGVTYWKDDKKHLWIGLDSCTGAFLGYRYFVEDKNYFVEEKSE